MVAPRSFGYRRAMRLVVASALMVLSTTACTPDIAATGAGGSTDTTTGMNDGTTSSVVSGSGSPSPVCGNGVPETAEECDDGNTSPDDGCTGECLVEGGSCAAPKTISVPLGEQHILDSVTAKESRFTPSCAQGENVHARYYALDVLADGFLTVTVGPTSSVGSDLILLVETSCGVEATGGCSNIASTEAHEILSRWVAQGTYYLVVASSSATPFDALVDLSSGENCMDPIPLVYEGVSYSVVGDLSNAKLDNFAGSCGGGNKDIVYAIQTSMMTLVTLQPSPTWTGILYDRSECTTGSSEGTCTAGVSDGISTSVPLWFVLQQGETRYVIVDRDGATAGPYSLTIGG